MHYMEELLKNVTEFIESGEENIKKHRFNAAVSDFFKAIVISCDYLIYTEIKKLPKNHNERFSLLQKYFDTIYKEVSKLFGTYVRSYNLRLTEEEANEIREYTYRLKDKILNKK